MKGSSMWLAQQNRLGQDDYHGFFDVVGTVISKAKQGRITSQINLKRSATLDYNGG